MRRYVDDGRHVMLSNGVLDVLRFAVANQDPRYRDWRRNADWVGRDFSKFEELLDVFRNPLPRELETVEHMRKEIGKELPQPVSVRRKAEWHDTEGDVDVQRAMRGDDQMFRRTTRKSSRGPVNVALLCDYGGNFLVTPEQLYWRGAACVAVVDTLEENGYGCELWCVENTEFSYETKPEHVFMACRVKDTGDPVDVGGVAAGMSSWVYRAAWLMAYHVNPNPRSTLGRHSAWPLSLAVKYLDLSAGVKAVHFPEVTSRIGAIMAAKSVLAQVTSHAS